MNPPRYLPRPLRQSIALGLSSLFMAASASAGINLHPGTLTLLPNRANQTVSLSLENTDPFPASFGNVELALEVIDPLRPGAPGSELPSITGVNFTLDTVYSGFSPTVDPVPSNTPQLQFWTVSLPGSSPTSPELSASGHGRLATLTFDTTGIISGSYHLRLTSTAAGDTTLYDAFGLPLLEFAAQDALLLVAVPEPSTMTSLTALALAALGAIRARARRRG